MVEGGRRGRRGLRRTPKTLARCMSASRARTAPVRKSDAIAVGISRRRPPPSSAPREVTVACENLDGRYYSVFMSRGGFFIFLTRTRSTVCDSSARPRKCQNGPRQLFEPRSAGPVQ